VAAATRRRIELECSRLLAEEDLTAIDDPVTELELHAAEILAWRDLLRRRLGELEQWRWTGKLGQEQLHATVSLYERALDRAERTLVNMTKIGLAERGCASRSASTSSWAASSRRCSAVEASTRPAPMCAPTCSRRPASWRPDDGLR
jgi:hypothetical protein